MVTYSGHYVFLPKQCVTLFTSTFSFLSNFFQSTHSLPFVCTLCSHSFKNGNTDKTPSYGSSEKKDRDNIERQQFVNNNSVSKQENSNRQQNRINSSKQRIKERIPHTRERLDMFWRGVYTANKIEGHAGLPTFSMVVKRLEAKPVFIPPYSPARKGLLLPNDYNVHIVASTASFGKKAVPRVRARRRLREACRRIFPYHAMRHKEYTITAHPIVLFAPWESIVEDVKEALRRTNCWIENIDEPSNEDN
eukprot:jgi/Galph1/5709/GphlegSOOS_G4344.1